MVSTCDVVVRRVATLCIAVEPKLFLSLYFQYSIDERSLILVFFVFDIASEKDVFSHHLSVNQQSMPPPAQPFSNRVSEPLARGSSLHTIKTQQRAKEEEDKQKQRRKRGVVVMMLQFLQEQGYAKSLEALQQESQVSLQRVAPADNVDMMSIFSEYEDYHEFRFGRVPKFYRTLDEGASVYHDNTVTASGEVERVKPKAVSNAQGAASTEVPQPPSGNGPANGGRVTVGGVAAAGTPTAKVAPAATTFKFVQSDGSTTSPPPEIVTTGKALKLRRTGDDAPEGDAASDFVGRQLKPMPRYPTSEMNELAMTIQRDILDANPNVSWGDIAELDNAKSLLKEAVVMPVKYPQLFHGIVRPWRGILLFGPPGTGKTMLAKALATECRTTFFNISASSIVSKWRGDSEKLVRLLFELAVHYAPSTIFIDELDSLMSARASDGSEHEGSRRMKTELLVQMDGLARRQHGDVVFVLAASNVPWDLDGAMLRRLEKRVMVGLPSAAARKLLLEKLLGEHAADDGGLDYDTLANKTNGHSGADIDIICREAMMRPVRALIHKLEHEKHLPTAPLVRPKVTTEDVLASIACTRSSGQSIPIQKYQEWEKSFGSGMSV